VFESRQGVRLLGLYTLGSAVVHCHCVYLGKTNALKNLDRNKRVELLSYKRKTYIKLHKCMYISLNANMTI
jgi:hypothetical protein